MEIATRNTPLIQKAFGTDPVKQWVIYCTDFDDLYCVTGFELSHGIAMHGCNAFFYEFVKNNTHNHQLVKLVAKIHSNPQVKKFRALTGFTGAKLTGGNYHA